jgi:tRNA pseudouridine38-40 synthase
VRPVIDRHQVWHVAGTLDLAAMVHAAQSIIATHDFAAFASRFDNPDLSTVRDLYRFDVCRSGDSIFLDVEGNAFLPHQVRRMTGALVEVGRGKLGVDDYAELLAGSPASAGPVAPSQGLSLMRVLYPVDPFDAYDAGPTSGRQDLADTVGEAFQPRRRPAEQGADSLVPEQGGLDSEPRLC